MSFDIGRVELQTTGRYTIVIKGRGHYSFSLLEVPADRIFHISIGDTVSNGRPAGAGTIESAGARHLFTFDGTKGQMFHLVSRSPATICNGSPWIFWRLLDPAGGEVTGPFDNICSDIGVLGPIPLPATGRYTLIVQSGWNGFTSSGDRPITGTYAFSLGVT